MCAPVVAVDAGHMKLKEWEGFVCLVACSIDGNRRNQLLAFAIVPAETEENYKFFLGTMLGSELNDFIANDNLMCVSDRGPAVLAGIRNTLPNATQRVCAMHLLGNFGTALKRGSSERQHYNNIAYGTDKKVCDESLRQLQESSPAVFAQLNAIGLEKFAETFIPSEVRTYGQRTSNLAEQRMAWLKEPLRAQDPTTGIVKLLLKLNKSYTNQINDLERALKAGLVVRYLAQTVSIYIRLRSINNYDCSCVCTVGDKICYGTIHSCDGSSEGVYLSGTIDFGHVRCLQAWSACDS
jgi:hypothetical protein